jgi:ribosomal protein S13
MTLDGKNGGTVCVGDDMAAQLNEVIGTLERTIDVTAGLGLDTAAALLRMARLDVLMRRYGISDEELEAFREALDNPKNTDPENEAALRKGGHVADQAKLTLVTRKQTSGKAGGSS